MKTIETERLILRSLHLDDALVIEKLAGDYDVAKTTLSIPHPYPKGSAKDFIIYMLQAESNKKVVIFSILHKNNKELIGVINLNLNHIHKRGNWPIGLENLIGAMDLVPKQRKHYYTMDSMSYI